MGKDDVPERRLITPGNLERGLRVFFWLAARRLNRHQRDAAVPARSQGDTNQRPHSKPRPVARDQRTGILKALHRLAHSCCCYLVTISVVGGVALLPVSQYPELLLPASRSRRFTLAVTPKPPPPPWPQSRAGDQRRRGHAVPSLAIDGRRPDHCCGQRCAGHHFSMPRRSSSTGTASTSRCRGCPEEVRRLGVVTNKNTPDIRRRYTLTRPDASPIQLYLVDLHAAATSATAWPGSMASVTSACWARANTRCASGSTRTGLRRLASPAGQGCRRCGPRPPGVAGASRRAALDRARPATEVGVQLVGPPPRRSSERC